MKRIVHSLEAPPALGPYSQAVRVGDLVFASGQIPLEPNGAKVAGGIEAETARCLAFIESIAKGDTAAAASAQEFLAPPIDPPAPVVQLGSTLTVRTFPAVLIVALVTIGIGGGSNPFS